jgi:hypothetical protein
VVSENETSCVSNCTRIEIKCSSVLREIILLLNSLIKCPLEIFKCTGNLVAKNRLISGYYSGQNVTNINGTGCNHGGLLDVDSMAGGINKDSGYFLFSPHADLHLIAAELGINHTALFFNKLREKIGDIEFNYFLKIKLDKTLLDLVVDFAYNLMNIFSSLFGF